MLQNRERNTRMKRLLCFLLAVVMTVLWGCAGPEGSGATNPPTDPPTDPPTEPPTDPPPTYTDPLTGEILAEPVYTRPFAVMLNNYKAAMPMHGASEASILIEALTEGGMTRCMGVYSDLASVETLGSIRSARKHFVSFAISFDAIYVHYGKSDIPGSSFTAQQYMDAMNWDHMDGTRKGYPYFYESDYRHEHGWHIDACHFLVGKRALDYAKDNNFALTRPTAFDYGWTFRYNPVIAGRDCKTLTVYFNQGGAIGNWVKSTTLKYDAPSGQYLSYQYGDETVDGNIGKQLCFKNVIVLQSKTTNDPDSQLVGMELEGSGTGYFACNGKITAINWSRASAYDPFVYTLADGTPVTFGVGKTYIAVVPTNATLEFSAK